MFEVWIQYSCDGRDCAETEYTSEPNITKSELTSYLRSRGWLIKGRKQYCRRCRKTEFAKAGKSQFVEG